MATMWSPPLMWGCKIWQKKCLEISSALLGQEQVCAFSWRCKLEMWRQFPPFHVLRTAIMQRLTPVLLPIWWNLALCSNPCRLWWPWTMVRLPWTPPATLAMVFEKCTVERCVTLTGVKAVMVCSQSPRLLKNHRMSEWAPSSTMPMPAIPTSLCLDCSASVSWKIFISPFQATKSLAFAIVETTPIVGMEPHSLGWASDMKHRFLPFPRLRSTMVWPMVANLLRLAS